MFIQADLGADPFNVLIQGIYRNVPWPEGLSWSHGRTHIIISFIIIIVLLLVDKKYVKIGTFNSYVFKWPIIDVFTYMLEDYINNGLPLWSRVFVLVIDCVILAMGMTIVNKIRSRNGPNDLVAIVWSDKWKKPFGIIRIVTDFCFVVTGFVFGGTFGVGTIICAFVVGPVAQIFMPYAEEFCEKIIGK